MTTRTAPTGPLMGNEQHLAIELLTDKQLIAYRYRREGQALNWIANRMGVSRARIVHLIAAAEKRLGYEPSVTPKQKQPYKPVAERREAAESAEFNYLVELARQLPPARRREFARLYDEAVSTADESATKRLYDRLRQWERQRQHERAQEAWERGGADETDGSADARHRGDDSFWENAMADMGFEGVKPSQLPPG